MTDEKDIKINHLLQHAITLSKGIYVKESGSIKLDSFSIIDNYQGYFLLDSRGNTCDIENLQYDLSKKKITFQGTKSLNLVEFSFYTNLAEYSNRGRVIAKDLRTEYKAVIGRFYKDESQKVLKETEGMNKKRQNKIMNKLKK